MVWQKCSGIRRSYLGPKTLFGPESFLEYHQKALKCSDAGRPACCNGVWQRRGDNFRNSQRDINAISEPDTEIPKGFRGTKC